MYLLVIYSLIVSVVMVLALKHFQAPVPLEDPEASKKQTKNLMATGFFLCIVCLIGFHWLGIGSGRDVGSNGGANHDYEHAMIQTMSQQTIQTGFPPF